MPTRIATTYIPTSYSPGFLHSQSPIPAGPASDSEESFELLDLNQVVTTHPEHTYYLTVTGDSMIDAGIYPGSVLAVDRALTPRDNDIVIAIIDGEKTVKRLRISGKRKLLLPENPAYDPIPINVHPIVIIWGVVTAITNRIR